MNHFFICRHCKSVLAGPDTERDLDSDGLLQSKSLSNKISELIDSNTIIYSSPFKRAVESLMPLKKKLPSVEIKEVEELKEINIGKSEDFSKHQIIEQMWKDQNFKVKNGESQKECFIRMKPFLDKLFSEYKNEKKNIILVTHGNLIGIIIKFYFGLSFDFKMWKSISMPDFYKLEFDENYMASNFKRDVANIENLFYVK
tara:strand:- start:24588 stop:25187 length:600 start_codon:yes stop_codon:yes gene_type:complete